MEARPIVHVPFDAYLPPELPHSDQPPSYNSRRLLTIRSADSHGQRSSANILIDRMYGRRGYLSSPLPAQQKHSRFTLVATDHDNTIGTLTIGFDSDDGLHVDDLFGQKTDELRRAGHRLCEFTKLAVDNDVESKRVLASLFHVAHLIAHRLMACDTLLIEVNPRHVGYYRRMLDMDALGPARHNSRVNAPAVLLCLPFARSQAQIDRFGGQPELSASERSLYPYFFSAAEEAGIISRMTAPQPVPAAYGDVRVHAHARHRVTN
ncbi:MAG: long-chain N-acyl amino acid synthase [Burkholderiales bacterium]